jgi:hypothetical protein
MDSLYSKPRPNSLKRVSSVLSYQELVCMKTGIIYLCLFLLVFGVLEVCIVHKLIKFLNHSLGSMEPAREVIPERYWVRKEFPAYRSPEAEQKVIDDYMMKHLPSPPQRGIYEAPRSK